MDDNILEQIEVLYNKGVSEFKVTRYEIAIAYFDELEQIFKGMDEAEKVASRYADVLVGKGDALCRMFMDGISVEKLNRENKDVIDVFRSAVDYYERAIPYVKAKYGDTSGELTALYRKLGDLNYDYNPPISIAEIKESRRYYDLARDNAMANRDVTDKVEASIGIIRCDIVLERYEHVLILGREIQRDMIAIYGADNLKTAMLHKNMGYASTQLGDKKIAVRHFKKYSKILKKIGLYNENVEKYISETLREKADALM